MSAPSFSSTAPKTRTEPDEQQAEGAAQFGAHAKKNTQKAGLRKMKACDALQLIMMQDVTKEVMRFG